MRINLKSGNPFTLTEKVYFSALYYMNKGLSKLPKRKPKTVPFNMEAFRKIKPDIKTCLIAVIQDPTATELFDKIHVRNFVHMNFPRGRVRSTTCPVNTRIGVLLIVDEIEETFND